MRKTMRYALAALLALWSAMAVALVNVDVQTSSCTLFFIRDVLNAATLDALTAAAVWVLALWLNLRVLLAARAWRRGELVKTALLSLFFAFVMTVGVCYRGPDEALRLFGTKLHLALLAFKLGGWFWLFFALLKALLSARWRVTFDETPDARTLRRVFALSWALLMLGWLPAWIARFPAALTDDASRALQMYYDEIMLTGDHPYGYTLLLGGLTRIGLALGDGNLALALCALAQSLLLSGVLAYTIRDAARIGMKRGVLISMLLLYALAPMIGAYASTIIKDSLYAAAFVGYCVVVAHAFEDARDAARRVGWWVALCVFTTMLLLVRFNGVMFVLPMTVVLFCKLWRALRPDLAKWRSALTLIPLIAMLAFNALVVAPRVFPVSSTPDILGVALQQTARIMRDHGEDVTEAEREAIDKLVDCDALADAYIPTTTDPVKRSYRYFEDVTLREKLDFTGVWMGLCARHPMTAWQAFAKLTFGYLDPLADGSRYHTDMTAASSGKYVQTLAAEHPAALRSIRDRLAAAEQIWRKLPLVSLLGNVGAYAWVTLITLFLLRRTRSRHMWPVLVPSLVTLAAALMAPAFTNGFRYAFPIMFAAPYLTAYLGKPILEEARGDTDVR